MGRDQSSFVARAGQVLFQFTRPHGARRKKSAPVKITVVFQFTRPHGARRIYSEYPTDTYGSFNSRARMGRDRDRELDKLSVAVSIHAPAWGATISLIALHPFGECFNSRARMGRDIKTLWQAINKKDVSIHAPAWGATLPEEWTPGQGPCFNSRARMGRDNSFFWQCRTVGFQFTRPHGARHPHTTASF